MYFCAVNLGWGSYAYHIIRFLIKGKYTKALTNGEFGGITVDSVTLSKGYKWGETVKREWDTNHD